MSAPPDVSDGEVKRQIARMHAMTLRLLDAIQAVPKDDAESLDVVRAMPTALACMARSCRIPRHELLEMVAFSYDQFTSDEPEAKP